ncbi:MAG TPA: type I DNA topoisomerase [Luteibaculaceae bacterium]|nr:type I DNA topoisomerase [Luteibaculaceae bacterium]
MSKNLVIVESPAKAKTIEGYLGKDFVVKSSFGHVRDLSKKGISIDIEKNFEPHYEVDDDKKKLIAELKKLAESAEVVWLATDEDREGEAISWHLKETLKLPDHRTKRITFNEITKTAILKAIDNPRTINLPLVEAQQARRILDRLVGFELSPVLWKKVKPSLSAGRVQSVSVRLLVEREREVLNFVSESYFRVAARFLNSANQGFKAELNKRFEGEDEARAFLEKCAASSFSVSELEVKPAKKSPAAPFTTSTLQQEASRKLGFSVARTMQVAQQLYESGYITYMRTDSVNLSQTAIDGAKAAITSAYGSEYSNPRNFNTKSKGAQEAHEAIRPTDFSRSSIQAENAQQRLYDLIWKRSIASQMADAQLEKTVARIKGSQTDPKDLFVANGEVIKFEGFLKVYIESTDDESEEQSGMLPRLQTGETVAPQEISATQRFTHHPPRYTEASLVKKLEELGIGRPSTYAPTISTIQKRGYVVKEDREGSTRGYVQLTLAKGQIAREDKSENTGAEKNKLFPTDIGIVVNDFLVEHFGQIMDFNFTAKVEKEFDDIADGNLRWNEMISKFYSPFHLTVENTINTTSKATGERELGVDPVSGKKVIARIGRYGPMVMIGDPEDESEKPRFASLQAGQSINSITLEQALDLFKLPRQLGEFEEKPIVANVGRFGPYIQHNSKFVSITKGSGLDPMTINLEQAIELIMQKREADNNKLIKSFVEDAEVQILNGRWGPYIAKGKTNYKIPKGKDAATLSWEEVAQIMTEADKNPAPKKRFAKK